MKMFSDCSDCCVCAFGDGGCLAGHGDDDFVPASKETIIKRLDGGRFGSYYRKQMIDYLLERYGYDYNNQNAV